LAARLIVHLLLLFPFVLQAQESDLLKITVTENHGLDRALEYIEFAFQTNLVNSTQQESQLVAEDIKNGEQIPCQISAQELGDSLNTKLLRVIFPLSITASGKKEFIIKRISSEKLPASSLLVRGEGLELIIENEFYQANLTKNAAVEPQSHDSGQIRELLIKLGFDQLITNVEDRVHWAPNFDRPEIEWYTTIAHWDNPATYQLENGPYRVRTFRQDLAPDHPEILLTATYNFYAGLPYFTFYSSMEMKEGVWLQLLRNDEMAMDSMFTHLAFERPDGEVIDLPFSGMHPFLDENPIENNSPWLCFYNKDEGFAFGSIRILYDNTNTFGDESILYKPHTQIGEWLKGVKYWNRRLIHNRLTYVDVGSTYREKNAYLVFKIAKENHLQKIQTWADRIRHPLQVDLEY